MEDKHNGQWIEAMQDYIKSLHKNYTYELVKLPKGIFKVEEHNLKPRNKIRLVVKGFCQRKGIDFD